MQVVMVVTLVVQQNQVSKELRVEVLDMIHLVMRVLQVLMAKLYTTVVHLYRVAAPFLVIQ